jgi:hypothetical protein
MQGNKIHFSRREQDDELPRLAMAEQTIDNDEHFSIHRICTASPRGKR